MSPSQIFFNPVVLVIVASSAGLQATEMDARIVSSAQNSHVFKTHLKEDKIAIVSTNGIVSLDGTVANEYHRCLAEDTVSGLPGVKEVRNQLQVKGEPSLDSPDGKLKAKVQAALLFHRNVSATQTQVFVKDGVVTLKGEAESEAQKSLTAKYVKELDDVKDVVNNMTVAKEPRKQKIKQGIDDASITAQVKMALLFNRGTSALHTKVVTEKGIVTLTGKAKSRAERSLCSKIASDLDGVRKVENRMAVES